MSASSNVFQHEPLDHSIKSIRGIRILPDLTEDGLIQCESKETTIDAKYSCLSYVWGEPESNQSIMMNGAFFTVRQNLFDFLETTRPMIKSAAYWWIDALCIDQSNTLERNHQVQQMGSIYSHAQCVYIWLGKLPSIPSVAYLLSPPRPRLVSKKRYRRRICSVGIYQNPYWGRAWVTQEIVLARYLKVLVKGVALDFRDFIIAVGYPTSPTQRRSQALLPKKNGPKLGVSRIEQYLLVKPDLLTPEAPEVGGRANLGYSGLIALLDRFKTWGCSIPRDRIFSLLALCEEGRGVTVDYDVHEDELAYQVLRSCTNTLCLCSVMLVGEALGISVCGSEEASMVPRCGPFVQINVENWKPRKMADYKVTQAGLMYFNIPVWKPSFRQPRSDLALPCFVTQHVFRALHLHAVFMPTGHTYKPELYPDIGEEVLIPEYMRSFLGKLEAECRSTTSTLGIMRLFAKGFSFGPGSGIRISLSLIWNLKRDYGVTTCDVAVPAVWNPGTPPFMSLGCGAWNTLGEGDEDDEMLCGGEKTW